MKTLAFLISIIGILTLQTLPSEAAVWPTTQKWSKAMDDQYQYWLANHTSEDMFATQRRPDGSINPYYGIRLDCADTVYALRAIFAYENGLPFEFNNPAGKNLPLINNEINKFDKYSDSNERFRQFVRWVNGVVSTRSMEFDTYSIPYRMIRAGTIILVSKVNHHSWTIKKVTRTGQPILIFNSTNGASAGYEVQERRSWPNPSWVFQPEANGKNVYYAGSYAGFRDWKPIGMMKTPESAVPNFSSEQHLVGLKKWITTAVSALSSTKETLDEVVSNLLSDACADFKQRVHAVADAEIFKSKKPSCMNATDFDTYSTPSRDRRLIEALVKARTYFKYGLEKQGANVFSQNNIAILQSLFPLIDSSVVNEANNENTQNTSHYCGYKISSQLGVLHLGELKRRGFKGLLSSNPNDSYTGRYGFSKTSNDKGDRCENFGLTNYKYDLNQMEQDALSELKIKFPAL